MVSTVRPKASATPSRPIPTSGKLAAMTALPQPAKVSQKVPMPSATHLWMFWLLCRSIVSSLGQANHAVQERLSKRRGIVDRRLTIAAAHPNPGTAHASPRDVHPGAATKAAPAHTGATAEPTTTSLGFGI